MNTLISIGTCGDCRYWYKSEPYSEMLANPRGVCQNEFVLNADGDASCGIEDLSCGGEGAWDMGADFGCVHWRSKEEKI